MPSIRSFVDIKLLTGMTDVTMINVDNLICPKNKCSQFVNGEPIYFDDDHLNAYVNKWLAQKITQDYCNQSALSCPRTRLHL